MSDVHASKVRMLGFSLPGLGLNTLVTAVFVFLPALYVESRGLSTATVGLVFFLAKIIDIIAAPIWGNFMDSYKTPWGRRRPWLLLSVPILMTAVFFLFNPPEDVSIYYLFFALGLCYIGWDAWTISHTSWALELSRDYDRRSRITSLLQVMSMLGAIATSMVPAVMEQFGTISHEEKTVAIGWAIMIILPLTAIICVLSVPERVTPNKPRISFIKGLKILRSNSALIRLLSANILISFSTYFVQGLFLFFVSYTLRLQNWSGLILSSLLVGGLVGLPLWLWISQKLNKHATMQLAMLSGAITPVLLLLLPAESLYLSIFFFLIVGLNTSANEFLPRTMIADVCDKDHIESGSERMGLYYSLLQLSSKFASGSGILIGFSFLTLFGFDPELGMNNTEQSLDRLRYLIVALPAIAYGFVIVLMLKYPIDRKDQHEMRKIIEKREKLEANN
jgi:GPH family glycoside/pentoside/hexuronide:cation symporter